MKTSVLLSAYKGERFLRQQLDSILGQTRLPDELVIIDDCSPDDGATIEIIKDYKRRYDFIDLRANPVNMGWAASFMNGLNYVTGDILFFADQDDVWDHKKIEIMADIFRDKKINGVISDCQNVDSELTPLNECAATGRLIDDRFPFDKHFIYPKGVGAAMAFRMDFIRQYKDMWVKGFGHDRFFQVMLVLFDRQYYLDMPLIKHRMHDNNATGGKHYDTDSRIRTLDGNIQFLKTLMESELRGQLNAEKIDVITKYLKFAEARRNMLQTKSLVKWLAMPTKDLEFYPTRNTWLGDLKSIKK